MTTDAAYHTWHLVFDKVLRDLEQERPAAEARDARRPAWSRRRPRSRPSWRERRSRPTPIASSSSSCRWRRPSSVSRRPAGAARRAEKALIDAHGASTRSPILGSEIDYSLFTPRGHYTRNAGPDALLRGDVGARPARFPPAGSRMPRRLVRGRWPSPGDPRLAHARGPTLARARCGGRSTSPRRSSSASPTTTRRSSCAAVEVRSRRPGPTPAVRPTRRSCVVADDAARLARCASAPTDPRSA